MSDPSDLAAFLDLAWQRLGRGVADRRSDARHISFATVSPEGWPEVRTVVMRKASRAEGVVEVHTDAASAKIASLAAEPRAELLVWDAKPRLQIRMAAQVQVLTGAEVSDLWARVPDASRAAYGKSPVQGTPISNAHGYRETRDADAFTVLRCQLQKIDLVELGDVHRRATYLAAENWVGQWRVP